jgi:hypothetical protein
MPRSRRRKSNPAAKAVPDNPSRMKKWWGAAITTVSLILGALVLWPQVTIDPTNAPQPSNPFSSVFKVANGQLYPINHVRIEAYLWCAKIGTGTDTTPPSMCMKGNIPGSKREWSDRTIADRDAYEITVGDVLFGTPQHLLYADISIRVLYQPWFVPIRLEREQRFYTRRKDDGQIEWLHKPLQ